MVSAPNDPRLCNDIDMELTLLHGSTNFNYQDNFENFFGTWIFSVKKFQSRIQIDWLYRPQPQMEKEKKNREQ